MKTKPLLTSAFALATLSLVTGTSYGQGSQSTLAKIESTNLIAVGHRETSVPFSYVDTNNNVVGFSQDLCNKVIDAVKLKTKHPDLRVRFIPVTSQNRIPLVQNGTIDLECGVTTNLTSRQNQVAFSDTFFVATTRLLTRKDSGIKDFPDLAGKTVVTNQGTTSERILRKMNEEKKMNMSIISAKDYGEGRATLETGRAVAYMMDDVLLAGTRSLTAKPSDWTLVGTPQSSEAYGFMMRKDDPEFKKLVDDAMSQVMRSPEIKTLYDKWFTKPVPPKNINFEFPMSGTMQKLFAEPNDKAFE
ncbi:MAG: Glutamate/aspartate ABC transporter, substrate-binding protein GltI (TC 3.A.1.3.4) [uncultured Paraburkholderia sp.]|uniref:glutamate/aspartate ABC transporter substrate-binding protein n=1 Tax=uncultured Paraburkholderia sp. TaxID=1822466 RepID=UPI002594B11D|nr:glutamate/aspartate ABC transporter substrate-binding protein [uncultured Paraburkholderia sp.]CAH2897116.1 MAG: Glutamate/aspartate ABC transporter, substrate-binding protein GltI (TC 3.A.1.3.4) [uncultured Paraburkholderia sp.]CAH2920988.1 MAG: Glutamate/aspartate ABC transporter, substrate-binding protein GltI (TC 3.A.1.3.4) [uncultured Paraburkholderia sp.]